MNDLPYKPYDEPHRDRGLEKCPYCYYPLPLHQNICSECTFERNPLDRELARKVLAWRRGPEGQQAYARLKHLKEVETKGYCRLVTLMGMFLGFILFGFIGLFFEYGSQFGALGAVVGGLLLRNRFLRNIARRDL
jgi:hypothetical protein